MGVMHQQPPPWVSLKTRYLHSPSSGSGEVEDHHVHLQVTVGERNQVSPEQQHMDVEPPGF